MHCPPPPTLEVLESVLAKRGLGLRRELVTPSVRTQQCCRSRDQRRCATCAMRAALAVCERFQHESSSPCYRSSGGWVECSRLSESAASCGATSSADTTSSSPGSRYRAREARRSSARSLRFVARRACTPSGQPGPWCLRCLLLAMCTYPFAKKALTLHLPCGEGRERYFCCNLMQRKVLASSHQHLMAEAPGENVTLLHESP